MKQPATQQRQKLIISKETLHLLTSKDDQGGAARVTITRDCSTGSGLCFIAGVNQPPVQPKDGESR